MWELVTIIAGVVLVVLVFADALATTMVVAAGAGPLTRRVAGLLWRAMLRLHRRDSRSLLLTVTGPMLLVTTVLLWVTGLWAGWVLVFVGATDVVVDARTGAPAGFWDVVYYTGFTSFTLGTGDYVAATPGWRVVSAIASFTGLFLVTLAITYLISVVSAVVARRALAVAITALGTTADNVVLGGWTGHGFSSSYTQHLVTLTEKLAAAAQQHLAYPVLNYFHSRHREPSAPVALARLEDAMLLLTAAVEPSARPHPAAVEPLRYVLERYITAAAATSSLPRRTEPPPAPSLRPLMAGGVPVVPEEQFQDAVAQQSHRRTALRRLVNGDGWSWPGGQTE
ncbi:MAG TPA: potassium channel family protein [Nocardioidaceae bacterium]|nr:potassium channel family protein [Nocardioidaceae bacterium]